MNEYRFRLTIHFKTTEAAQTQEGQDEDGQGSHWTCPGAKQVATGGIPSSPAGSRFPRPRAVQDDPWQPGDGVPRSRRSLGATWRGGPLADSGPAGHRCAGHSYRVQDADGDAEGTTTGRQDALLTGGGLPGQRHVSVSRLPAD